MPSLTSRQLSLEETPSALRREPIRQIAVAAGIGKTAAADQLLRLERQGLIHRKRGEIVDQDAASNDALRQLRVVPDRAAGSLTILRMPRTTAYEGTTPRIAHPLLVYTEMMASTDLRAREAAAEIRERFLEPQP